MLKALRPKIVGAYISDLLLRRYVMAQGKPGGAARPAGADTHVLLAPSYQGNLGDEAMLTSCIANIRKRSSGEIVVLTHRSTDDWRHIDPEIRQISVGGFFSAFNWNKTLAQLLPLLSTAKTFNVLGADIMDGVYSRTRSFRRILLLEWASKLGCDAAVLGFSYSDRPIRAISDYFSQVSKDVTLHARDKVSHERLKHIARGPLEFVADTAFLMPPADHPGPNTVAALAFAASQRAAGRRILVFNANPLGSAISSGAARGDESVSNLTDVTLGNALSIATKAPDAAILFVSHDPREPHSDASLLERVYEQLPQDIKDRCFLATREIGAREIKSICAVADLAVTGRMHLGIAALGSTTPCLFLDFAGKVQGLLAHFDAGDMIADWKLYMDKEAYGRKVADMLDRHFELRAKLAEKLPHVQHLSSLNFQRFGAEAAA